ncbi:hypothetical protein STVA_41290 [Allostella vacuolata]|nr:hypothetical protein STVA_41290 [Stella vacuolata]
MTPAELRERRKALSLSQGECARRAGTASRTWQRWEAGDQDIPAWTDLFLAALEHEAREITETTMSYYLSAYSIDTPVLDRVVFDSLDDCLAWVERHVAAPRDPAHGGSLPWAAEVAGGRVTWLRLQIPDISATWRDLNLDWRAPAITTLQIESHARATGAFAEEVMEGNRPQAPRTRPAEAATILDRLAPLPTLDEAERALTTARDDTTWCTAYNLILAFDRDRAKRLENNHPRALASR